MMRKLARRAVGCKHWRWMPGMLEFGFYAERYTEEGFPEYSTVDVGSCGVAQTIKFNDPVMSSLPDLSDPATLGCLLALVREALQLPVWVRDEFTFGGKFDVCWKDGPYSTAILTSGSTEAEALVAALEAAP